MYEHYFARDSSGRRVTLLPRKTFIYIDIIIVDLPGPSTPSFSETANFVIGSFGMRLSCHPFFVVLIERCHDHDQELKGLCPF